MRSEQGPVHVSAALSELIQRRGYARSLGQTQLRSVWEEVAGSAVAAQTRVTGIQRGALQVEVSNSALLSELVAFQRTALLKSLRERYPELNIKDVKFRLNGNIARQTGQD